MSMHPPPQPFFGNTAVPPYLKYAAVAMVLVTYFGVFGASLFIALTQGPDKIPSTASFIIGTGLTYALNLLSQHVSSSVGEQATTQAVINQAAVSRMETGAAQNASTPTP